MLVFTKKNDNQKQQKKPLLSLQITVINLYFRFHMQDAIFDFTMLHNKFSSLVLSRGQLFCQALYRICVGRYSLLHIFQVLILKVNY